MGCIIAVGPHQALIASGSWQSSASKKIIIGGWLWASAVSNISRLSLNLMTVFPTCKDAETLLGVPINATGVAQFKIKKELVRIAAEQFTGRKVSEIKAAVKATLEGHLRAILGTMTVEETFTDLKKFAESVREMAEPDMAGMGFTIISFTIKDISDEVGYFRSIGQTVIANVKRDAAIGVVAALRDGSLREFQCFRDTKRAQLENEALVADNRRRYEVALYSYKAEIEAARAAVALAYDLQSAIVLRDVKENEKMGDVIEERKNVEMEEAQIRICELLMAIDVKLPADAECYRVQTIAEAVKNCQILLAKANREKKRIVGRNIAAVRELVGCANIERLHSRARVFRNYSDVAITSSVLNVVPQIVAAVCRPLKNVEEIIILEEEEEVHGEIPVNG